MAARVRQIPQSAPWNLSKLTQRPTGSVLEGVQARRRRWWWYVAQLLERNVVSPVVPQVLESRP